MYLELLLNSTSQYIFIPYGLLTAFNYKGKELCCQIQQSPNTDQNYLILDIYNLHF